MREQSASFICVLIGEIKWWGRAESVETHTCGESHQANSEECKIPYGLMNDDGEGCIPSCKCHLLPGLICACGMH